jgi:hypothetical protein
MLKKDIAKIVSCFKTLNISINLFDRIEEDIDFIDNDEHHMFHCTTFQTKDGKFFFRFFRIGENYDLYRLRYIKYNGIFIESDMIPKMNKSGITFADAFNYFSHWIEIEYLSYLEEINMIDEWEAESNGSSFNFDSNFTITNEKFTKIEIEKYSDYLKELKTKVLTLPIPIEQIEKINIKLDLIGEKLHTETKFDWKSFFIGSIANLIQTLALPSSASGTLWTFIRDTFSNIKNIGN